MKTTRHDCRNVRQLSFKFWLVKFGYRSSMSPPSHKGFFPQAMAIITDHHDTGLKTWRVLYILHTTRHCSLIAPLTCQPIYVSTVCRTSCMHGDRVRCPMQPRRYQDCIVCLHQSSPDPYHKATWPNTYTDTSIRYIYSDLSLRWNTHVHSGTKVGVDQSNYNRVTHLTFSIKQWYSGSLSFFPESLTLKEGGLCWYSFRTSSSISESLPVLLALSSVAGGLDGPPPNLAIASWHTWQTMHPSAARNGTGRAIIALHDCMQGFCAAPLQKGGWLCVHGCGASNDVTWCARWRCGAWLCVRGW